jgi:hypothetical protein
MFIGLLEDEGILLTEAYHHSRKILCRLSGQGIDLGHQGCVSKTAAVVCKVTRTGEGENARNSG